MKSPLGFLRVLPSFSLPLFSLARCPPRWARRETFAQFRVSRFTSDWHWPRLDVERSCSPLTVHAPASPLFPPLLKGRLLRPETRPSRRVPRLNRLQVIRSAPLLRASNVQQGRNGLNVRGTYTVVVPALLVYPPFSSAEHGRPFAFSAATDHRHPACRVAPRGNLTSFTSGSPFGVPLSDGPRRNS